MNGLEITKELKHDIEVNQIQLQNAIRNHQDLMEMLNRVEDKELLLISIKEVEEEIIKIGLEQKNLLERLREEYKAYQKTLKSNSVKSAIEERRANLSNALSRARKQNFLPRTRSSPTNSLSDESESRRSPTVASERNAVLPHDVSQAVFLEYFRLATHEVCGEMQRKRAERKRRSTANPHFLYGSKGWDFLGPPVKRKRSHFLTHPPSPPNTRGRKRQEMARSSSKSPPESTNGNPNLKTVNGSHSTSQKTDNKSVISPFPSIPNLPSGLIIERISPDTSSHDSKQCIVCKQPGDSAFCSRCSNNLRTMCQRVSHELSQPSVCPNAEGVPQMSFEGRPSVGQQRVS